MVFPPSCIYYLIQSDLFVSLYSLYFSKPCHLTIFDYFSTFLPVFTLFTTLFVGDMRYESSLKSLFWFGSIQFVFLLRLFLVGVILSGGSFIDLFIWLFDKRFQSSIICCVHSKIQFLFDGDSCILFFHYVIVRAIFWHSNCNEIRKDNI